MSFILGIILGKPDKTPIHIATFFQQLVHQQVH